MEHLNLSEILKIDIEKIFNIISSVELYPEFVPGYKEAKLLEKRKDYIKAHIIPTIPVKDIVMEAHLFFPEKILFRQLTGPLDVFEGEWVLNIENEYSTKIDFHLKYHVKNFFLRKLVYKFVRMSFNDILTSFKIRGKKQN